MKLVEKCKSIVNAPLWKEEKLLWWVWISTGIIYALIKFFIGKYNNYKIFKYVFPHSIEGLTIYGEYPAEYYDSNQYGILFSALIAPFSVLPDWLGLVLWITANTAFLFSYIFSHI